MSYICQFEMPEWVARMPKEVGYPAGGSLTSDEWKALAMVYCPIIVSCFLLWLKLYLCFITDTADMGGMVECR